MSLDQDYPGSCFTASAEDSDFRLHIAHDGGWPIFQMEGHGPSSMFSATIAPGRPEEFWLQMIELAERSLKYLKEEG